MSAEPLTLRVAEALAKDVGRGIARLDPEDMARIGAEVGDFLQLLGKRATVSRAMPTYMAERGQGLIQIDGITRENAQAGLGERLQVQKTSIPAAAAVVLAPLSSTGALKERDARYIGRLLEGLAVAPGDKVRVSLFGTRYLEFLVVGADPPGPAAIQAATTIKLKGERAAAGKGPGVTYEDIGGLRKEIQRIREMIELPLKYPEVFERLGIEAPKGVLLHGPPGCGKTLIGKAVASETDAHFTHISGPEVIHKFYGESEAHLRALFEQASQRAPAIIFIDEIDAIAAKREEVRGDQQVERRVVAQLLALMDGLKARGQVIVIGATNIPNLLDPALRRPGRFDREIAISIPDRDGRLEILQIHTRGMPLAADVELERLAEITHGFVGATNIPNLLDPALRRPGRFDREIAISIPDRDGRLEILQVHTRGMPLAADVELERLAEITHGFVGADLEALCKEGAMAALRQVLPRIDFQADYIPDELLLDLQVGMDDFLAALKEVEPSAIREVFTEIPDVRWEDVGGLSRVKALLRESIQWPLQYAKLFDHMSTPPPKGILLHGPPGTGKTLLAKAVAKESGVNFIAVQGPALLSKWVGESERALREVFRKARQASPCILFFDEIDALIPHRDAGGDSQVTQRVISQFLTELDGIEELKGVIVLAATNRRDLIDPALLRAGRLDLQLELPLPDAQERWEILQVHLRGRPLAEDVDVEALAQASEGLTGADLEAFCKSAAMGAIREFLSGPASSGWAECRIGRRHLEEALASARSPRPSPLGRLGDLVALPGHPSGGDRP